MVVLNFWGAISTRSVIFGGTVNRFTEHGLHSLPVIKFLEQVARFFDRSETNRSRMLLGELCLSDG